MSYPSARRWRERCRRLLPYLLGLYALYLIAGNVFLNTPLFDQVTNRKPHKFVMSTGPAITLLPGHVIAWNVQMRGHVNHTVYVLRADRASARLAVLPLFRREVRIPSLQASGVAAEIARVDDAVPSPPRSDRGWTLRFDAIHSETIRSFRVGSLLIIGQGRGTVGFVKQLRGGPSELLPSQVEFSGADVSVAGTQLLDDMHLKSAFSYPRHYRDQAPGLAKLGLLHAVLEVQARSQGLRLDTDSPQPSIASAAVPGQLQASIVLDRGALQPGSHAVWRVPLLLGAGAPDRGTLAVQLDAARDIRLQARLPARDGTGSAVQADLHVAGRHVPFTDPGQVLGRLSGTVKGEWTFTSLNWIPALFVQKPWFRLQGGGLLRADLRLQGGELAAGSSVDIPAAEAVAEVAGVRMQGTARAHGQLQAGTPSRAVLAVTLPTFKARAGDGNADTLFDGRDLALTLTGDGRLRELRRGVRARLQFSDATVPDLSAYNRYLGQGQLRLLGGSGQVSGDVHLDTQGRIGNGRARLRIPRARLSMAGLELQGDARADARLQRGDFAARRFDLAGSVVELRDVAVSGQKRTQPWWGRLTIARGDIDAQSPFQVDGRADLSLRDAGPLLAVFAERGDYPRWALSLLDSGQLDAHTRLRWRPGHLVLDDLEAENERLSLRARLDLMDKHKRGDLYLRWGVLGAGIELDDQRRQWHLAGAREWFDSRPALLSGASLQAVGGSAD